MENECSDPAKPAKKRQDTPSGQRDETRLEPSGEVVVTHHKIPPKGPADKQIHPRRPLPPVPNAPPQDAKESKKNA